MTPVIGLLINAVVQIMVFKHVPGTGLLKSIYFGFLAGLCGMVVMDVVYWISPPCRFQDMVLADITNIFLYMALGYCYFHFVGLGETSRRIRMLAELRDSGDGLSLEGLLARYSAAEIVKKRLDRLLKNGQLKYRDGKYFIGKPVVLSIAAATIFLKLLFLGRTRESDRGPA